MLFVRVGLSVQFNNGVLCFFNRHTLSLSCEKTNCCVFRQLTLWFCHFSDGSNRKEFFVNAASVLPLCLHSGSLTVGLVRQCQTIHGRDRTCMPPQLPPEWITTLFFIILGIISLTVTCGLLVMSRWRREAARYARWIAFTGSRCSLSSSSIITSSLWINSVKFHMSKLVY